MISNNDQRVLFYDASETAFTDITKEVNDFNQGIVSLSFESGDYLYFGSYLPFNHKFFKLGSPNATTATATVETFNGTEWNAAIDQLDYTDLNGATFGRSGILQFQRDKFDNAWAWVSRTTEHSNLTEFANGPQIYDKYWGRISFNQAISFQLKYVGSKFSTDDDLYTHYPYFQNTAIKNSWETGKTDWEEQTIAAAEFIIFDLKQRAIIDERSMVIETSIYKVPSVHYTAHIIWNGLGPRNYAEEIDSSSDLYTKSMNKNKFEVDVNTNATKDRREQVLTQMRASR